MCHYFISDYFVFFIYEPPYEMPIIFWFHFDFELLPMLISLLMHYAIIFTMCGNIFDVWCQLFFDFVFLRDVLMPWCRLRFDYFRADDYAAMRITPFHDFRHYFCFRLLIIFDYHCHDIDWLFSFLRWHITIFDDYFDSAYWCHASFSVSRCRHADDYYFHYLTLFFHYFHLSFAMLRNIISIFIDYDYWFFFIFHSFDDTPFFDYWFQRYFDWCYNAFGLHCLLLCFAIALPLFHWFHSLLHFRAFTSMWCGHWTIIIFSTFISIIFFYFHYFFFVDFHIDWCTLSSFPIISFISIFRISWFHRFLSFSSLFWLIADYFRLIISLLHFDYADWFSYFISSYFSISILFFDFAFSIILITGCWCHWFLSIISLSLYWLIFFFDYFHFR